MLIDYILNEKTYWFEWEPRIKANDLRKSRRIRLTKEASRALGEIMEHSFEVVLRNLPLAVPPFENMAIEYYTEEVWPERDKLDHAESLAGWLVQGRRIYPYQGIEPLGADQPLLLEKNTLGYASLVHFSPWAFDVYPEGDAPSEPKPEGAKDYVRDFLLNAYEQGHFSAMRDQKYFLEWVFGFRETKTLTVEEARHVLKFIDFFRHTLGKGHVKWKSAQQRETVTTREDLERAASGDIFAYLTIMVLLNQEQHKITYEPVPRQRRFVRGKLKPFLAHDVVTIKLGGDLRAPQGGGGQNSEEGTSGGWKNRAHEVRGHFRTRARHDCDHSWLTDEEYEGKRFVCQVCNGKRTWVASHQRGDAGIGFKTKEYVATYEETTPRYSRA